MCIAPSCTFYANRRLTYFYFVYSHTPNLSHCESVGLGSNPGLGSRRPVSSDAYSSVWDGRYMGSLGNMRRVNYSTSDAPLALWRFNGFSPATGSKGLWWWASLPCALSAAIAYVSVFFFFNFKSSIYKPFVIQFSVPSYKSAGSGSVGLPFTQLFSPSFRSSR